MPVGCESRKPHAIFCGAILLIVAAPATAQITSLDTEGNVGSAVSMTIGSDGLPLIAYHDISNLALKVAHCQDAACNSANLTSLEVVGAAGIDTSTAVGVDGLGLIAFQDSAANDLRVAHCENLACSTATITTLDSVGNVGDFLSLAIGADGLGLIAYNDVTNRDLKVAHCLDIACSQATLSTVATLGNVGFSISLAIGTDGLGLIVHHESQQTGVPDILNQIHVSHCVDLACTAVSGHTLPTDGRGEIASLAIGMDGLPLVSFRKRRSDTFSAKADLAVAHCNDVACATATVNILDNAVTDAVGSSIVIGPDGRGLIAYFDLLAPFASADGVLKAAHCADTSCSSAVVSFVDRSPMSGIDNAAAVVDGRVLLAYYQRAPSGDNGGLGNNDLKVVPCWNADCRYLEPINVDADANGYADALARSDTGAVRMLLSTGGAFAQAQWTSGFVAWRYDVYFADVTGDGRADLISRHRDTGDVEVWSSTGSSFTWSPGSGPFGTWTWGFVASDYDLYFGDVTGDGVADLVTRVTSAGNAGGWAVGDVYVFPSTGQGFSSPQAALWSYGWSVGYDLLLGDVNGDARADIVARYTGPAPLTGDVYVALSSGTGFNFAGRWTYGFSAGYDVYLGDLDGDRRADLVGRYQAGEVYRMYSDGKAFHFPPGNIVWLTGYDRAGFDVLVRAVRSGGRIPDLVSRGRADGFVKVGSQTWTAGIDTSYDLH
jgi:hypothetical protein